MRRLLSLRLVPYLSLVLVLVGCQSTMEPTGHCDTDTRLARSCADLLATEPHLWSERVATTHALGKAVSPHLVDALAKRPAAPGAQAAIALLGHIGDDGAAQYLEELVRERGQLAAEAALALGQLRATAAATTLVQCAVDRFADATLRTAAACAAVRIGQRREVATVLQGVMLAGTPAGRELQSELGLPDKARWAYERYLIQRLLRDEAPDVPGFDTDASWPELERATLRLMTWLLRD